MSRTTSAFSRKYLWIALALLVPLMALAGIIFVLLFRPVALSEVSDFFEEGQHLEESDDPSAGHNHRPAHAEDDASEDRIFPSFPALDGTGRLNVKAMHPLGESPVWLVLVFVYA